MALGRTQPLILKQNEISKRYRHRDPRDHMDPLHTGPATAPALYMAAILGTVKAE